MEKGIEQELGQIQSIFLKYGVVSAYLFGSAAKGQLREGSDIDFLFSFPNGLDVETYYNNYFSLCSELETLLKRKVDLVAEKTLKNIYLIESIDESKIRLI